MKKLGIGMALVLVACSGTSDPGPAGSSPTPPPGSTQQAPDAGPAGATLPDAGPTPAIDAGPPPSHPDAGPDAAPPVYHCASGLPASVSDLASLVTGSTASTVTPMGSHFETPAQHTPTSAELAFLADPTQSPSIPASTSGLHLQAFKVTLYPSGKPAPADINQHAIGDCDGDTAMASMAYLNAPFVESLLTDHHDGTFSVAMFDPMGHPLTVKVNSEFLADGGGSVAAVSGKNGVADWATVLEKAVMKYNDVYHFIGDIGGIGSEFLTPLFTGVGTSFAFDRGVLTPAQVTRVVKASLAAGQFISGGFGTEKVLGAVHAVTAHGYAVLVPPDAATMVAMRNPWGVNPLVSGGYDPSTDGVLDLPATTDWAQEIDLRIIDPGAACGPGVTAAYHPPAAAIATTDVRITERHAR